MVWEVWSMENGQWSGEWTMACEAWGMENSVENEVWRKKNGKCNMTQRIWILDYREKEMETKKYNINKRV